MSALLATDRVIPVAHNTTFDALRDINPLLAARSRLTTGDLPLDDVAKKVAAAAVAEGDCLSSATPRAPPRQIHRDLGTTSAHAAGRVAGFGWWSGYDLLSRARRADIKEHHFSAAVTGRSRVLLRSGESPQVA